MAEGPRAPLLRAEPGAPMGKSSPPVSKSQPASPRLEDPHESVTIAPPAPNLEEFLRQPTPVPSLTHHGDQHFRTAIDAGARAGSSLSELSQMAVELSNGVVGARQANERLLEELGTLRALLASASEQQLALKRRIAELEQEAASQRNEAERERRFLTSQHDAFIAALMEEHEQALGSQGSGRETLRLAQQLAQAEAARVQAEAECERARQALARTQAQRDEAHARAEKRERERDELRAEASQLRARLGTHRAASTAPPPAFSPRPPSYHPPPALRLDAGELDSALRARPSLPRLPSAVPRRTLPPAELSQAIYTPAAHAPERISELPLVGTLPGFDGTKPSAPAAPPSLGAPPSGWTPPPSAPAEDVATVPPPRQRVLSAASLPLVQSQVPLLKQKPDPASRPLISYSLGQDGVESEMLEGVRLSSKPPRK